MKLLRDAWLVFAHYGSMTLRSPGYIALGLAQPALYLFLFTPLLIPIAAATPNFPRGGAYNVFVPGLVIQMGAFGGAFVGFPLIGELRSGVIERLRVTPVSRLALMLGRSIKDLMVLLGMSVVLIVAAIPLGLHVGVVDVLVVVLLQALVGLLASSLSYVLALTLRSEDRMAAVLSTATLPLLLLSGMLLPLSLAPIWLRVISLLNPLTYAVAAARAVFTGHVVDLTVLAEAAVVGVLAAVSVVLAARAFGRAVA